MICLKVSGNSARVIGFGIFRLAEDDGECGRRDAVARENANQRARIDTAREKNAYRNVAHQLHANRFVDQRMDLFFGVDPACLRDRLY